MSKIGKKALEPKKTIRLEVGKTNDRTITSELDQKDKEIIKALKAAAKASEKEMVKKDKAYEKLEKDLSDLETATLEAETKAEETIKELKEKLETAEGKILEAKSKEGNK